MKNIKMTGANNLNKIQLFNLGRISNNYYNKIDRMMDNVFILNVNLKCHERVAGGDNKKDAEKPMKFGVHLKIKSATNGLEAEASDWDLNRTLHTAFKKLLNEIEHKFKIK